MPVPETPSRRILSVHYLRAVAAIMVVLYHIFSYHLVAVDNGQGLRWLQEGVALFFAISGYVMVSSTQAKELSPASFLWRRIKRIVPLYWLATFCVISGSRLPEWRHILASLFFVPAADPQTGVIDPPILDVGWTLNFEMAFYLLFAFSMLLPRRTAFWTLACTLVLLSFSSLLFDARPSFLAYYGQSFLLDFVAGMLIAHYRVRMPACCFPIGFILLALLPQWTEMRLLSATIPSALILASALSLDRRLPEWRLFTLLGEASYAIYLSHLFVVVGFLSVIGVDNGRALTLAAALFGAVMTGILVHLYLELPLKALVENSEAGLRRMIAKRSPQRETHRDTAIFSGESAPLPSRPRS